ncbi:WASH complex subunit 2-like isoform X2 [Mercenaria mercenaria]|uniref:WASH complex subunit 2-like isoform X2 n=1 Tax=Mercenaria mercenaria TaxID=6596 RepID=UPI00234F81EF|nr:WASH complex subunit 2-like isoform X2 [Mercenaria mercenaria]
MSDLLNFDDDDDNLFKPQEQQTKPSRDLDDIFGTNSEAGLNANTLDDILTPAVQDDIFETKATPKKKHATAKNVDSLFGDVDDEPDIFSTDFGTAQKSASLNVSNPLEDDLLGDFVQPSGTKEQDDLLDDFAQPSGTKEQDDLLGDFVQPSGTKEQDDLLGDFVQPSGTKEQESNTVDEPHKELNGKKTNEIDDLFTFNQSDSPTQPVNQSESGFKSYDEMSPDESADSLDILLNAQPMGTVPSCDDLLSLVEPVTNTATSSNKPAARNSNSEDSVSRERDPLDDFFEVSEPNHPEEFPVEKVEEDNKDPEDLEESSDHTEKPEEEFSPLQDKEEDNTDSKLPGEPEEEFSPLQDKEEDNTDSKLPGEPEEEFSPLQDKEEDNQDSDIEEPPVTKPRTNLKKNMERSFEDLLNGLSDESEPELDDMIVGDIDNTNLERRAQLRNKSLLESPDKSQRDIKPPSSDFTTPSKPLDLDFFSSTPMEKSAESPEVKVITPEVKVLTPDDEEVDKEEWAGEKHVTDTLNGETFDENDVVMRPKKDHRHDSVDGDDLNLEAIEDTNHLDVDVNKHKSALGKKGSMALRRKPSRKSRKSLLSSDDDAIFQDSTDSKPVSMTNGNDDDADDGYDLSPPAKKPSPAVMLPLPGMAGRPPSQRNSSADQDDDNAMDTKEVKRSSKPPPGAFVLPSLGKRPAIPQRSSNDATEKEPENKPAVFEKPALKSVKPVEKSPSPEQDHTPAYSRAGLRSSERQETEKKGGSEERDIMFQKPTLRSTPKPRPDKSPEEKMDTGVFEKPKLRSTPKPKWEQKHSEDKDIDVFEPKNLRSVQKQDADIVKESSSDKHVFDKPSLRSTGRRLESRGDSVKEETHSKMFDKPALRTTNKPSRTDSLNDSSEPSHTFDKPTLRSTNRTTVDKDTVDSSSHGTFEKPSLKKATPSPEKETKEFNEPKGIFDKPALRKTEGGKEREKPKASEKPDWLQQAANKHTKALEAIHTKENHHGHTEKETPSWLESSPLRKTRGQPLQDSSNGQSTSSSHADLRNTEDSGKQVTTPRSRNSSMSSENELERKRTPSTTGKESNNNYTPSWMRQTRSPSVPTPGVLGPAKSLPSLSSSNEVPQWKRELAQRRQSRKEKSPEEIPKKEESVEPDWKKGIQLRKTRNTAQPSKEVKSVEPEWKKAAEERHARLRNSTVHGNTD